MRNAIKAFKKSPSRPHTIHITFDAHRFEQLRDLMHRSPREFGKQTIIWTLDLVAEVSYTRGLTPQCVTGETMRATLVRFGFRWASQHPKWAFSFVDEIWWSRVAFPSLHTWTEADRSLPLAEQTVTREDGKKALACYGLLLPRTNELWLRFVEQIHLRVQQEEYHDTDPFS